eukprot:13298039-Ditylum_brightwellii.AAC.1
MFSNSKDDYHCIDMDNLFNFVLLCIAAMYYCPKKALMQGGIQKNGRGVHVCVTQEQPSGKRADAAHGTVKAAVLQ